MPHIDPKTGNSVLGNTQAQDNFNEEHRLRKEELASQSAGGTVDPEAQERFNKQSNWFFGQLPTLILCSYIGYIFCDRGLFGIFNGPSSKPNVVYVEGYVIAIVLYVLLNWPLRNIRKVLNWACVFAIIAALIYYAIPWIRFIKE